MSYFEANTPSDDVAATKRSPSQLMLITTRFGDDFKSFFFYDLRHITAFECDYFREADGYAK